MIEVVKKGGCCHDKAYRVGRICSFWDCHHLGYRDSSVWSAREVTEIQSPAGRQESGSMYREKGARGSQHPIRRIPLREPKQLASALQRIPAVGRLSWRPRQLRPARAPYAADFPMQGTAEKNKATAQGTITYLGTYSVSEADHTIAIHIEASSFPNWNGADQKRAFAIIGDQLTLTARARQTGGHADVVWKRAH